MGWNEDHRNTVADRWGKKFLESGMTASKFSEYMRKVMTEYGWDKPDIDRMIERAIGKETK